MSVIAQGLPETVIATVGGIALDDRALLRAGLALLSPRRSVRVISRIYVEGLRGTSEVVQLFWMFFVLPCSSAGSWCRCGRACSRSA